MQSDKDEKRRTLEKEQSSIKVEKYIILDTTGVRLMQLQREPTATQRCQNSGKKKKIRSGNASAKKRSAGH